MSKQNTMVLTEEVFPAMAEFIDWLFKRLAAKYGGEWVRQWDGVPIGDAKSDWGFELSWTFGKPDVIRYALQNLPERCPNSIEFRNICRRAPTPDAPKDERRKADPVRVKAVLANLAPATAVGRLDWAHRIKVKDEANPRSVTATVRKMYRDALGLDRAMPEGVQA